MRFWQQTFIFLYQLFLWQRNFIGFLKPSPSARLYFEVLVTIPSLNLKTVCIDRVLCYISFFFLYRSVFFSSKVTELPLTCHYSLLTWKLINCARAFYLSFCCTVLPRILNILIIMKREYLNYLYLSIIFYAVSYAILHRMVFVTIFTTSRYII